ncbi:hypothetical protein MSPP1_002953 [Malassezia sp. CBS 17886]|nr:hypothetical protein MSPP1_002953 [Malassezia sp. CBS 17886]
MRHRRKAQDARLREAVTLYHLTPGFYPVPPRGETDDDAVLDTAVAESIFAPFSGERDGRPFVQFANSSELLQQRAHDIHEGRKDALGEMDLYDTSRIQYAFSAPSNSLPDTGSGMSYAEPVRLRQHFAKQPNAYASRRQRDVAGHGDLYNAEEMSYRSAQVRDALFGTVAGELPGLDAVRDAERVWDTEARGEGGVGQRRRDGEEDELPFSTEGRGARS